MIKDTRRSEELFEALGELDDDVIADAKHISSYGENVVVVKRTPLWKTIAGWSAGAACLAVLAVGGIFGYKYISGRNAVTPPAPAASVGTSILVSDCHAYSPPEFPEDAKYVYTGDYSELEHFGPGLCDREAFYDIIALEERSDLIVIGEFTDDPHQFIDPEVKVERGNPYAPVNETGCNIFKIDKVVKGRCFEGEEILIFQYGFVNEDRFYHMSNLTPMLKGDKWIYFLRKDDDGYYPIGDSDGRYPVPGSEHEFALNDNVYGVFDTSEFRNNVYEDIKKRLPDWKYDSESGYPEDAKYVFMGDYGELEHIGIQGDRNVYSSCEQLADISDLIVSGKFTDFAHQTAPTEPTEGFEFGDKHWSYNTFNIDKVIKGDKKTGDSIIISQPDIVYDGQILFYQMSPMIFGDSWVYFLEERDGYYYPINEMQGRYPLPDSDNKVLKDCGKYGYYGDPILYEDKIYAELVEILETFEHTVSKNCDGVILSVKMKKDTFAPGEDIRVTATVRNTTDKPIGLLMGCQGENSHAEISTRISRGRTTLVDKDIEGKGFDDALDSHIVQPGEEYVQEMNFVIPLKDSIPAPGYEVGEYKGTATITLLSDPNDVNSEVTEHSVEFSLTIDGENADTQTAPDGGDATKVYDSGKSEEEQWTMEEFPGVTFRCGGNSVSVIAERNPGAYEDPMYESYMLYMGMPIFDVYLADLNGDGMREIVSTVAYGSGMIDMHIEAFDYANCIGYTLWDRGYHDYVLKFEDGRLIVRKFVYMENDTVSEQPLTLDMMTANDSEIVFKGSEPAEWTMDEFPGTTFSADIKGIYAEKDGVVKNVISNAARLLCVKLTDNDGDGKRDIVCEVTDDAGMRLISVYYANGLLLEYSGEAATTDEITMPLPYPMKGEHIPSE